MSQTVKVNSLIQNIVHSLLTKSEMLSKNILIMKKTLTYLGYGRRVRVSFLPTFTKKNLKLSGIEKLISECIDLNDNEEEKLSSEAILKSFNIIYNNINTISHKKVSVDLNLEKVSTEDEKIKLKAIDLLLSVGILKVSSLNLSQKSDNRKFIDFQSASSGEQCIVLMLLGIAGSIKDNSLICIDEPEISLHPEWQSTFISLLISTFEDYKGCHFIIATHSPQIVSELHGKNSYILNMDENKLHSSTDYLYRSADYQLATLFSSPGMQNEYLNRKVVSLLTHLSKNRILDTEQTAEVNMLFSLTPKMNKEDPVRVLIDILRETLEILSNDK